MATPPRTQPRPSKMPRSLNPQIRTADHTPRATFYFNFRRLRFLALGIGVADDCVCGDGWNVWRLGKRMLGCEYLETAVGTLCSSSTNPKPTQTSQTSCSLPLASLSSSRQERSRQRSVSPATALAAVLVRFLFSYPQLPHQALTQVRGLCAYVCLCLSRGYFHQWCLSVGRTGRKVLQQAQMQQRSLWQLPLGQRLSRFQQHS